MIESGIVIGRTSGMEETVAFFLSRCQRATYFQSFGLMIETDELSSQAMLVLQHWPDEYSERQVQELIQSFPLTRIICCYGELCAADGRSKPIWPNAMRVPVAKAIDRIEREELVILNQRPPLEKTAGLDEVFAFDQTATSPHLGRSSLPNEKCL